LQNYAECLSGDRASDTYLQEGEQLLFMAPTQPKPLLGCVDNEMKLCSGSNLECAGQENSNYVFSLDDGKLYELKLAWKLACKPLPIPSLNSRWFILYRGMSCAAFYSRFNLMNDL